jgi:hypothetical protein
MVVILQQTAVLESCMRICQLRIAIENVARTFSDTVRVIIFFPNGSHNVSVSLIAPSNDRIEGMGNNNRTIQ